MVRFLGGQTIVQFLENGDCYLECLFSGQVRKAFDLVQEFVFIHVTVPLELAVGRTAAFSISPRSAGDLSPTHGQTVSDQRSLEVWKVFEAVTLARP